MKQNRKTYSNLFRATAFAAVLLVFSSCVTSPDASSNRSAFSFVQLCDTQLGTGGYEHDLRAFEQAVRQINELKPDFVVICGDLVTKPDTKSYADFNRIRAGLHAPSYCVPGNHDVLHTPYERKMGITPQESLANYRKSIGKDYYSFEHKGCIFVCVNTQLWKIPVAGESEKHDSWVKKTLASSAKDGGAILIVGHHPLFIKDETEPESYMNLPISKRAELLLLYERHSVSAVLSGHTHRAIINDHKGIQLVTGQATSRTHGGPLGFRLWSVTDEGVPTHESVDLDYF